MSLFLYFGLAFLVFLVFHTLVGNRLLPGKVGVVKVKDTSDYSVYKYHRIMGIPVRRWLKDKSEWRSMIDTWVSYNSAVRFSKIDAFHLADLYSNNIIPTKIELEEVWNNRQKKTINKEDTEVLNLLGNAIREDNEPEILRLSNLLKSK